ncbi:hypothetical protein CerSpe_172490 [Prunus speciosa]
MKNEVQKLKKVGFVCEVDYQKWVSNVVMVKETPEKWRMCVDFTDLNKAYPKDSFPLPRIDQLVDTTAQDLRAKRVTAHSDLMLIVNQINNTYQVKGKTMGM